MEIKDLSKYIKLAQKFGLKSLKLGEIEIEFKDEVVGEPIKKLARTSTPLPSEDISNPNLRMPGDDEMLIWSTDSFDQLREDRKAK